MKNDLQSLAIDIFHFCVQNCICLKVQWIPRELNTIADQYTGTNTFEINLFSENTELSAEPLAKNLD
jgi:hypothetical protein